MHNAMSEPIKVEYDKSIEVSAAVYNELMVGYAGVVAGRFDGEKYFIKVLYMKYAKHIEKIINRK